MCHDRKQKGKQEMTKLKKKSMTALRKMSCQVLTYHHGESMKSSGITVVYQWKNMETRNNKA